MNTRFLGLLDLNFFDFSVFLWYKDVTIEFIILFTVKLIAIWWCHLTVSFHSLQKSNDIPLEKAIVKVVGLKMMRSLGTIHVTIEKLKLALQLVLILIAATLASKRGSGNSRLTKERISTSMKFTIKSINIGLLNHLFFFPFLSRHFAPTLRFQSLLLKCLLCHDGLLVASGQSY